MMKGIVAAILALAGGKPVIAWVVGANAHGVDHARKQGTCLHVQLKPSKSTTAAPYDFETMRFHGDN